MPKISKDWQIKNFAEKIHQKIERVIENLLFQCGVKKIIPKWMSKLNAVIFKITTIYKRFTKWNLDIKEETSSLKMKLEKSPCWLRNTMGFERCFSQLRAPITLSEDLDSIPSIWCGNRTICNSSSGGYIAILWSPWAPAHGVLMLTHTNIHS